MIPVSTLQQWFERDASRFKTFVQTTQGLWLGKPAEREINVVISSVNGKVTEVREKFARAALGGPDTSSPELDQIGIAFTNFIDSSIARIRELATANATASGEFTQMTVNAGIRPATTTRTATAETRIVDTIATTTGDSVVAGGESSTGGDDGGESSTGGGDDGGTRGSSGGGFNPLWLILAGVALGALAISASRSKQVST